MRFGEKVKLTRTKQKMSVGALSKAAGMTLQTVAAIEDRKSAASIYIFAIAKALGVKAEKLMTDIPMVKKKAPVGARKNGSKR